MKIFNTACIIGAVVSVLPVVQMSLSGITDTPYESVGALFFFSSFPLLAIAIYYILIREYFILKETTIYGQVSVGILTILLYIAPIILSLAWMFDIDGSASSDALNGVSFFLVIPICLIGLAVIPAVILVLSKKRF